MIISRKDKSFLILATKMAENSELRQRHGAVAVRSGSVLALGFNKMRNNPLFLEESVIKKHSGVHAEIDCLKKIAGSAKGATLYVARLNNSNEIRYSAPCPACQDAIDVAGVKRVVYTLDNQEL